MSDDRRRSHVALAAAGVLALLATFVLAMGAIRETEASWNDAATGQAMFGAVQNVGQNHARAVAGFGVIQRQVSSATIGPGRADAGPITRMASAPLAHESAGALAALPLRVTGSACAATREDLAGTCGAPTTLPAGSSYAASETSRLGLWAAGLEGIENLSYGADTRKAPIRATATCIPGQTGKTSITAGDSIVIRSDTRLYLPTPQHQTSASRDVATRTVKGLLQNHQSSGPGWAKAELRLYAQSDIVLSDWTLHVVLASAECKLAGSAPAELQRPTSTAPANLPVSPNAPTVAAPQGRASFRQSVSPEEQLGDAESVEGAGGLKADGAKAEAPASAAPADATTTPETPGSEPTEPTESEPTESEAQPGTTSAAQTSTPQPSPSETTAAEPTEQASATEGPQQPALVRTGEEFAVVNRDGLELGSARIEDIVRTPGCGVELTLSITTSDEAGADRWRTVEPTTFAEVRPGGSTRDAKRVSADCAQASKTTALQPGRDYEIVIAFQLDDSAQRAMLRPAGTAGWIVDLPPLPTAAPTTAPKSVTPPSAATPTTSAVPAEIAADLAEA